MTAMTAAIEGTRTRTAALRRRIGRRGYLMAAGCVVICTVMLLPLVASVSASLKPTVEAAASPPTYFPHSLSLDSYARIVRDVPHVITNSAIYSIAAVSLITLVGTLIGYIVARRETPVHDHRSSIVPFPLPITIRIFSKELPRWRFQHSARLRQEPNWWAKWR